MRFTALKLNSVRDLLLEELRDLYSAETQIVSPLPDMVKNADNPELKQALQQHLDVTRGHVQRLEQIGTQLNISPRDKKCAGMEGILKEGKELLQKQADPDVLDAGIIAGAQSVEHYEIAGYTTARNLAQQLRHSAIVSLLSKSLAEEENADQLLNQVARSLMSVAKMPAAVEQTEAE